MSVEINNFGCPCGQDCCDDPDVHRLDHDEPDDPQEFCEACYAVECDNCHRICHCELY